MIIEKDKTFRVGDLVRVSHPNGAGAEGWYCQPGTLGIITRLFGNRCRKGPEVEISTTSVGIHWFYAEGWDVVQQDNLFAGV